MADQRVLIVGSGPDRSNPLPAFQPVFLDIEPRTNPDIVASMTDLGEIGKFDSVYCCHALEHLYPHEVNRALSEFRRVLKRGGTAVIIVPDLEGVKPDNTVLKRSNGSEITGLHMFYGDHALIEEFPFMAHHCGFVADTLEHALTSAGFAAKCSRQPDYNLIGIGINAE